MIGGKLLPVGLVVIPAVCVFAGEKILYETRSKYNTIIVTEDDDGLRSLLFERGGALQSVVKVGDPDHVELPYARVMPTGLAFVDEPKRILIVGLGGGTIPNFLHKHYPKTTIDVVDIDSEVVDVAKRFFGVREDATLHLHVDDGRRFIEQCKEPYDVIFLDAFGRDNIPYSLATREFLRAVKRALTPEGVVIGNVWSRVSNSLYDSMIRTYQNVFDELYIIHVRNRGNRILIALPRKQQLRQEALAKRADNVSLTKQYPFQMGEFVRYGYNYAGQLNERGRVLVDKPSN